VTTLRTSSDSESDSSESRTAGATALLAGGGLCPRCGYDQRGEIVRWESACPMDGRCTECGLTFEWGDVLSMKRGRLPWCIEHVERRAIPRGTVNTLVKSLRPWRFWRQLRLSHIMRLRRLALYVFLILIMPFMLAYVPVQVAVAVMARAQVEQLLQTRSSEIAANVALNEATREQWQEWRDRSFVATTDDPSPMFFKSPNFEDDFPTDEAWEEFWSIRDQQLEGWIEQRRDYIENPPQVRQSYWMAVFEAVFTPLSSSSRGEITFGKDYLNVQPYIAPRELYVFLIDINPTTFWSGVQPLIGDGELFVMLSALLVGWVFLIGLPISFVLLPITRRRAKVRLRHFVRVTGYSTIVPVLVFWLTVTLFIVTGASQQYFGTLHTMAIFAPIVLPIPLLAFWWYHAIRHHLRLPHAFWLVVVMSVLTLIAIPALTTLTLNVVTSLTL
jgi:hypothetical protein